MPENHTHTPTHTQDFRTEMLGLCVVVGCDGYGLGWVTLTSMKVLRNIAEVSVCCCLPDSDLDSALRLQVEVVGVV